MIRAALGMLALGASLGLSACTGSSDLVGREALIQRSWVVQTIDGRAAAASSADIVTIDADGQVHGRSGCASISGRAVFDGNRIDFQDLGMSAPDCSREMMTQSARLLDALKSSDRWSLQDRYLLLFREGSVVPSRLLQLPQAPKDTLLADQPARGATTPTQ